MIIGDATSGVALPHPDVRGARYALVPGEPGRVWRLAERLDEVEHAPAPARLPLIRGHVEGVPVVIAATGMGGASTARVVSSLLAAGCTTLIRAGGAGPVVDSVRLNDVVVGSSAVRHTGAPDAFLPPSWPAVADPSVTAALLGAARDRLGSVHCGVLHSKDSLFGELDPSASPVESELRSHWVAMRRLGVLASEMEAATLFVMATAAGARAGAIVKVDDPDGSLKGVWTGDGDLCDIAVDAVRRLIHAETRG